MNCPWVINHPPPWLTEYDVLSAMTRLGYLCDIVNVVDQRRGRGPHHDRLVVLPDCITVTDSTPGMPPGATPRQMRYYGFSDDKNSVHYWDPHLNRSFVERTLDLRYSVETLPSPPPDVMGEAIAFSRWRSRPPGEARPPRRLDRALATLKQIGHLWPTMQ